jgi:hypothetical protein
MSKVVDGLENADSGCDLEMFVWKTQVRSPNVSQSIQQNNDRFLYIDEVEYSFV